MKLYAQQGSGTSTKIDDGLSRGWIDGAILSPKDNRLVKIREHLERIASNGHSADRMFDPQFFATMIASVDGARLGKLNSEDYPYFESRRRSQLEVESQVRRDIEAVLRFESTLNITHYIAPNIIIPHSLNSVEAAIAKSFIRNTKAATNSLGNQHPVYATLAIGIDALRDKSELESFLNDITLLDERPYGFYLLVCQPTSAPSEELIDSRSLAGWMFINHTLNLNGYKVINGYSDILTPFLCAAGGMAGATGWSSTLKSFALDRFEPAVPGGQQPTPRYLSCGLINSIRFDELHRIRSRIPSVMNNLPSDAFYPTANSKPADRTQEMLQTWNAIQSLNGQLNDEEVIGNIGICLSMVRNAREIYAQINTLGLPLTGRSNDAHLDPIFYGIKMFADLAEIELRAD
jgi:hypothetical protein